DGIPEDREEPLSLYLVRTGKLTEAQARRLRGEAMQLPLVCLECERESILLRCVAGEGLACPSCAGAVLFRPAPVRALLEKRRLLLHGSLAAALVGLLVFAVWRTPLPRPSFELASSIDPDVPSGDSWEEFGPIREAIQRDDLVQAKYLLLSELDGTDPEAVAEGQRWLRYVDASMQTVKALFVETEAVYPAWLDEATRRLDEMAEVGDARLAEAQERETGRISLDQLREFYRSYLFRERNQGMESIRSKALKELSIEKPLRRRYLQRLAELQLEVHDRLSPRPEERDVLIYDLLRDRFGRFPDLGVEEVILELADLVQRNADERSAHVKSMDAELAEVRLLLEWFLPVLAARRLERVPAAGTTEVMQRLTRLQMDTTTTYQKWNAVIGGDAPEEGTSPATQDKIQTFLLSRYEVTNRQYAIFMRETGHPSPPGWHKGRFPEGREDHPVVHVSFKDAEAFCDWVGGRIPTTEEWEWAAQSGPEEDEYAGMGNRFDPNLANVMGDSTTPVGSYPEGRSAHGVFDLAGNVWEFVMTADGPAILGGSFLERDPGAVASATKTRTPPHPVKPSKRAEHIGFRVLFDI
ncbi:MAG: SUMF1/EgtB/PvdO family nonheme iron enzyme, partial [Planctomycetota bacterium]|nr:SUMF1/EgtB/PvdO family nonheme iron enzyme [Planctomycetota bacterium]